MLHHRRNNNRAIRQRAFLNAMGCALVILVVVACGQQRGANVVRGADLCVGAAETSSSPSTQTPPSSSTTADGHKKIVFADHLGFDPDDATELLQNAINTDADTVVIPYKGRPWIVRPITLRSNLRLMLDPGVVLQAKKGHYQDTSDSVLLAQVVENISIIGYGATIRMNREDYKSSRYEKGEWRHGICLKGASNVQIRGLRIEQTGGDAIYIGPTWDKRRVTCTNIEVEDCILDKNHRQGITVVSAVDVRIENCHITGTAGTAPQAGIDLEPSHPADKLSAILVRRCVADGNAGSGIMANLTRLSDKSEPISIRVERCLVRNSVQPGLRAILRKDYGARGFMDFVDCAVESTQLAGATIVWDTDSQVRLRFDNCRWANVGRRAGQAPFVFELTGGTRARTGKAIEFVNAKLFEKRQRKVVRIESSGSQPFSRVSGQIQVEGARPILGNLQAVPNLHVRPK
ncbi:MAG: right-handed parallel beta-helix repeat-containing protein [Planctomycetota bacterium]